jgi:hypothetical protein
VSAERNGFKPKALEQRHNSMISEIVGAIFWMIAAPTAIIGSVPVAIQLLTGLITR